MLIRNFIIDRKAQRHIFLLIFIPITISFFYKDWFIGDVTASWLDQWCNTGFFLHYADPTYLGCSFYKISRLSWIVPGFLAYKIFSPLIAALILHIGSIVLTGIFLYLTIATITSKSVAFLMAAFWDVYLPIQGSGGWDYQNLPSGVFYSMTLFFLTRAAFSLKPSLNIFISGACFAATLSSVIQFVNMFPILILWYSFLSQRKQTWKENLIFFTYFSVGGILLTLSLCFINLLVGRQFLFFKPIIDLVIHMVKDPSMQKSWWQPWSSGWLTHAIGTYLLFPAVVFLACLVYITYEFSRMRKGLTFGDIMVLQFFASSLLWGIWQSIGQTALQPSYFAYPLSIPMMMGLAGLVLKKGPKEEILEGRKMHFFYKELMIAFIFVSMLLILKMNVFQGINSEITTVLHLYLWPIVMVLAGLLLARYLTPRYLLPFMVSASMIGYLIIQGSLFLHGEEFGSDVNINGCNQSELFLKQIEMDHFLSKFSSEELTGILWDPKAVITSKNLPQNCSFSLTNYSSGLVEITGHWFSFAPWDKGFLDNSDPQKIPDKYYLSKKNQTVGVISTDPSYTSKVITHFHAVGRSKMNVVEHLIFITSYYPIYFDVITD